MAQEKLTLRLPALTFLLFLFCERGLAQQPLDSLAADFVSGYAALNIGELQYSYKDLLTAIPGRNELLEQKAFMELTGNSLARHNPQQFSGREKILYDHIAYEVVNNLERIKVQTEWIDAGRLLPANGLFPLDKAFYRWLIKQYTAASVTPEEVFELGKSEVIRVKKEIGALQREMRYTDSAAFYNYLASEAFYITDKEDLLSEFRKTDSIARQHLPDFIGTAVIPPIFAMEWPGATASTPPGMYLNSSNSPYGKDVFQFNFYNNRYNKRAIEWLYMHEAIPGHHLQFSVARQENVLEHLFYYPGNFEGWGCYVEYFGKELGLYRNAASYLGKWEWDLVRSARLVIDVGIHYYGWTREQALQYWKQTIPNQNDIAEREVSRVTNWPGQALSYKVGAAQIFKLQAKWRAKNPERPASEFNRLFLSFGRLPLSVIEKNIT